MSRLYGDENFDVETLNLLKGFGYDAVSARDIGMANQHIPDDQVLLYATSQNRAVVTFNRKDFFRLHKSNPEHAGIIACTYDADRMRLAQNIDDRITEADGVLDGKLIRVWKPNL